LNPIPRISTRVVKSPSRSSTRVVRSPSITRKYQLSPKIRYSRPRLISERVVGSPLRPIKKQICPCKSQTIEYQETILEEKRCPMCNSILVKKMLSPIRKSVESNISHLGNIQKTPSISIPRFSIPENEYHLVKNKK
jgi:hypothetical protein